MNIGHVPRCALLPHRHTGRLDWGKAKSIQLRDFRMGQVTTGAEAQFCLRYHSSDVFTVIGAEVRPSQRVNKKPHKVWVAVQTNGTILLIVHWYDSALWHYFSLCVCDCQRYMKCMNTVVYLVHFWHKNMAYLDSNFDGIGAVLMRNSWHYFSRITWGAISNMGWPHITPVCLGSHSQEPWGDGDWDWLHHRRRPTRTSQYRGFTGGRSGIV